MEVKFNTLINEQGLYATKYYLKGETVFTLTGVSFYKPTRETIHVGKFVCGSNTNLK